MMLRQCGWFLAASIFISLAAGDASAGPLVTVRDACGAPTKSAEFTPPAKATHLQEILRSQGWQVLEPANSSPRHFELLAKALYLEGRPPRNWEEAQAKAVRFFASGEPIVSTFVSGRDSYRVEPSFFVMVHEETNSLVLVFTFHYRDNKSISIKCLAYGDQNAERTFFDEFSRPALIDSLRSQLSRADRFISTAIGDPQHQESGPGFSWSDVRMALVDAEFLSRHTPGKYPFSMLLRISSMLDP
jgi:hypothetical protein